MTVQGRRTNSELASVIDNAGMTNFSPRILVTFDAFKMFKPFRLPKGQFVSFHSAPAAPSCVFWSEDLKIWNDPTWGQRLGGSTYVDETATNVFQRIVGVENSADTDDRERTFGPAIQMADNFRAARVQRTSA